MTPQTQSRSDPPDLYTLGQLTLAGSDFERTKPLLLLCYLCLEGPKERRHLAELFWPAAAAPLASLATELSRLKRFCGNVVEADTTHARPLLQTDAQAFLKALEQSDLGGAASLYKGRFLSGVHLSGASHELEEWVYSTRDFLAGRVADALLGLGEAAAKGGDFEGAARRAQEAHAHVAALEPEQLDRAYTLLVANAHPWAAKLREEALELGLSLGVDEEGARRKLRPAARHTDLPVHATNFIGRGAEVREVADLLRGEARLVTIAGPAGMGKSRLASEVVRALQADFSDGVHLVWLVALSSPDDVPTALANALGLELKSHDILPQLARRLADTRCLLYFDNYEHVVAGATLLSELLTRCPNLNILVTSRERLNLAEEWVYWLEGLPFKRVGEAGSLSEAAQLFVQRAKQVGSSPTQMDLEAAEEVARRVEGSPLALELAASWTRVMPWGEVAAQLREDMEVLRTTLRNVPERHRSIETAFEYSWRLLSTEERRVLRELSVFRGGFSREAAREVVGAGLSVLVSLVDKSLLKLQEAGRFGRHPLLYAFTKLKLAEHPGDEGNAYTRHTTFYVKLVQEAETQLRSAEQAAWLDILEREHDNLRAVLRRTLADRDVLGPSLAAALVTFWHRRGHLSEGRAWLRQALEQPSAPSTRAALLCGLGRLAWGQHDYDAANRALKEALVRFQTLGDGAGEAEALHYLGGLERFQNRFEAAQALLEASLVIRRERADHVGVSASLHQLGVVAKDLNRLARARALFEEGLALAQRMGDVHHIAFAHNSLGVLASDRMDWSEARVHYEKSLTFAQRLGYREGEAALLNNLGKVARAQGDLAAASGAHQRCLSLAEALGNKQLIAMSYQNLGIVAQSQGDLERAEHLLSRGLRLRWSIGDELRVGASLEALAYTAAQAQKYDRAAKLLGAAQACRERVGVPLTLNNLVEHERVVKHLERRLGRSAFEAQRQEGAATPLDTILQKFTEAFVNMGSPLIHANSEKP